MFLLLYVFKRDFKFIFSRSFILFWILLSVSLWKEDDRSSLILIFISALFFLKFFKLLSSLSSSNLRSLFIFSIEFFSFFTNNISLDKSLLEDSSSEICFSKKMILSLSESIFWFWDFLKFNIYTFIDSSNLSFLIFKIFSWLFILISEISFICPRLSSICFLRILN